MVEGNGLGKLLDIELEANIRFGAREMSLAELLEIGPGAVIPLDRQITDPVDLIIGDKVVARGEVVLVQGKFGLRVTETSLATNPKSRPSSRAPRWTDVCGNQECRTGWLQLFRNRSFPRFEGKWACSAACMERMIADAVRSQIESWEPAPAERALRMPLGLILLSRGWISQRELQEALAAQRCAQNGRIGEWLHRLHGISEETITKALGIQWSCTVMPSGMPGLEFARWLIPAFLRNRYGLAPL